MAKLRGGVNIRSDHNKIVITSAVLLLGLVFSTGFAVYQELKTSTQLSSKRGGLLILQEVSEALASEINSVLEEGHVAVTRQDLSEMLERLGQGGNRKASLYEMKERLKSLSKDGFNFVAAYNLSNVELAREGSSRYRESEDIPLTINENNNQKIFWDTRNQMFVLRYEETLMDDRGGACRQHSQ